MENQSKMFLTKRRHVVIFAGLIGLLLIAGAYFYFNLEKNVIQLEKHNILKAIAKLKVDEITNWHNERIADAEELGQSIFFKEGVQLWLKDQKNLAAKNAIINSLNFPFKHYGYDNIFVTTPDSKFLISEKKDSFKIDTTLSKIIKQAVLTKKIEVTDLYFCEVHKQIHFDIVTPIFDNKKTVIATVVFRIDPNDYLYPLVQSWPVPSNTSETLIFRNENSKVLFLNELRHQKNTALKLKIELNKKNIAAVQALLGTTGIFEGNDYRNIPVLSYITEIPMLKWFMIAKVDKSEIYSELYYRAGIITVITLMLIIGVVSGLSLIYNSNKKKIFEELFIKEKEIREYHEEFRTILYSIGDGVITTDLKGNVLQMNQAAAELTGWPENESVGKPIDKVYEIINESSRKKVENPIVRVLNEGVVIGLANHTVLISKDGREIPIADSGAPVRDYNGNIKGTVLVFRDKSNEHEAEKLIIQNESRLKRAEFVSKSGNWELHLNSKKMYASDGSAKIYGLSSGFLDFEVVKSVPLPEYWPMMDTALSNLIKNNSPYDIEFKIRNYQTGQLIDIHSVAEYDKEKNIVFGIIQDITDRKKIEEKLKEHEYFLDESQHIGNIGSYAMDIPANKWVSSSALDDIFGIPADSEKNTASWNLLVHPEDREEMLSYLLSNVFGNKEVFDKEYRIIRANDKQVRWIWGRGELKLDDLGNPVQMIGTIQDITDKKIYDQEQFRLLNIIENSLNEIYLFDPETLKFEYVNYGALQNLGYSFEEMINLTPIDLEPEFSETSYKKAVSLLQNGEKEKLVFETIQKRKDGTLYKVEVHLQHIISDNKKSFLAVINDITKIIQERKLLDEERKLLKTIVDNLPIGLYLKDKQGRKILCNPMDLINMNKSENEVIGKTDLEIIPTEIAVNTYKDDLLVINSGDAIINKEEYIVNTSGENRWLLTTKIPHRNQSGEIIGLIGMGLDITERKLVEDQLQLHRDHLEEIVEERTEEIDAINRELVKEIEMKREAERLLQLSLEKEKELSKLKSRFISTASHEFRTPLTSVLSSAELIQRYSKTWNEQKMNNHLNRIKNSVEYLDRLIEDVLTVNRADSGKLTFNPQPTDLRDMCLRIIEETQIQAGQKHEFIFNYLAEQEIFNLDAKQMYFILQNLVSNAYKYSPDGGKIEIKVESCDNKLIISVSDQGIGIPEEEMNLLFQPFHRLSNTESIPGTGLGLSIVKNAVEIHNGKISVKSDLGKCTTFITEIPICC